MQRFSLHTIVTILIDCSLLALCLLNAPTVAERARLPFNHHREVVGDITYIESAGDLRTGDVILMWNADTVIRSEIFEFLGDLSSVGDTITITYQREHTVRRTAVTLVPFYDSSRFLIVSLCVGFITWLVALFILFNRAKSPAAGVLHWALIAFSVSIMITWGHTDPHSFFPFFSRSLFFISYTFIPTLFLLFTSSYPKNKIGTLKQKSAVIIPVAVVLIAAQSYYLLTALYRHSINDFNSFQRWFDVFNMYLILSFAGCIVSLFHSYYSARRSEERRRLEWILWGFCVSPIPFVLLIKIPQLFGISSGLIPEEFTTFFFLLIPFSFAVSLVRYNVMDIQLVISRSIVSLALTVLIGAVYSLIVLLTASSFGSEKKFREYLYVGAVILIIGLVLNPVRKRLQQFMNEVLFPARSNFRKATADITDAFHTCLTPDDVYVVLKEHIEKSLPFDRLAVYEYTSGTLTLKESKGGSFPLSVVIGNQEIRSLSEHPTEPTATQNAIDSQSIQHTIGCSLCLPLLSESKTLLGMAGGTPSETARRLSEEELDLFTAFCTGAGESLDRLLLQKKIFIKNIENERLKELSSLKSYFVSSVSHELRTPLTSIRMFAEMVRTARLSRRKQREYLGIIEGESGRLSRLIDNVLNFSVIEQGKKEYHREMSDLRPIVERSISAMKYLFQKENAVLKLSIPKRLPRLFLDADAMEEVIINLLSNALKYSPQKKHVTVRVRKSKSDVIIDVSDKGIGIPGKEQKNVFGDFYRVNDPQTGQAGGAGLGLPLVKQIVEFHGGKISVRSVVGKGSTFTITLPLKKGSAE